MYFAGQNVPRKESIYLELGLYLYRHPWFYRSRSSFLKHLNISDGQTEFDHDVC